MSHFYPIGSRCGCGKAEAPKTITSEDALKWTTSGLLLPHEIFGSLYNYMEGQFFFALLAGIPGETWLHACGY